MLNSKHNNIQSLQPTKQIFTITHKLVLYQGVCLSLRDKRKLIVNSAMDIRCVGAILFLSDPCNTQCGGNKIKWRGIADFLKNSVEVKIFDNTEFHALSTNRNLTQKDIDDLRGQICDMTLVMNQEQEDCVILWIQNQCEWEPYAEGRNCSHRTINVEDEENFPGDCSQGMNWKGTLDTFVEGDSCKLNWTSLVKQPACVQYVKLVDQKTRKMKRFMTTWSDQNFPIEYKENFDKIEIYDNWNSCFETNTKAICETDSKRFSNSSTKKENEVTGTIVVICVTVLSATVVISIVTISTVIVKKQGKDEKLKGEVRRFFFICSKFLLAQN